MIDIDKMLQLNDRNNWENLAKSRGYLRYPKTEYTVTRNNESTFIAFQTFVTGGNNRLVYVGSKTMMSNRADPDMYMDKLKEDFEFECKLALDHHTFTPETSIDEPFI